MQSSKLVFSEEELLLASDAGVILTKNRIIDHIYQLFGQISHELVMVFEPIHPSMPDEMAMSPKISKGEKYLGLPWVMLDYPRFFQKEPGYFALRTMFWWGNYFAVQFICSGRHATRAVQALSSGTWPAHILGYPVWAIPTNDPWNNQVPQPGITPISGAATFASTCAYLKIMVTIPLTAWEKLPEVCLVMADVMVKTYLPED